MKKQGRFPFSPNVTPDPTYAHEAVGTQRYSRSEVAALRQGVRPLFGQPTETQLEDLIRAFERIQGRVVRPAQHGYLIRLHRLHGPGTLELLTRVFRERGTTENLLLAVELAPASWKDQGVVADESAAAAPDSQPNMAVPDAGEDDARPWRCHADLGSGHRRVVRPDGTDSCRTCQP